MNKILSVFVLLFFITTVTFAQNADDIQALIKQGIDLHNAGKYPEAIEKYNEALKIDPQNGYADYELAFSLYASKKGNEAIPYLEKTVQSINTSLYAAAYSLLGSIYDANHQTQKAIDAYNSAIKINPDYPQLFFNEGIAYFRNQQYAGAETCAIEAIKHEPKNASNERLYALVTFHQNKRMNALLGLCSFILLEPNTSRSTEAYNNIQSILKGGVLKDADGHTTPNVSTGNDKETSTFNTGLATIAASAKVKKLAGIDLLEYELKSAFILAGQSTEKKADKTFFDKFFSEYFYKLALSDHITAFAHTVASTIDKDESAKWDQEHAQEVNALNQWVQQTEREF